MTRCNVDLSIRKRREMLINQTAQYHHRKRADEFNFKIQDKFSDLNNVVEDGTEEQNEKLDR